MAHYSQLLGYFILNMNETEGHSPSLSKFLKQLLFVFKCVAKKKENNITKDQQREASATY